jgi:hypothetical protein
MNPLSRSKRVTELVEQIVDLDQAQSADLRQYVHAVQAGRDTADFERTIEERERLRAKLYREFCQEAYQLSPTRIAKAGEAGQKLIELGGSCPDLEDIPRRRVK